MQQNASNLDINYNLKHSYAWYAVSNALGKETSTNHDGTIEDIDDTINSLQTLLKRRSLLQEANNLAIKICATISKCKQ